MTRHLLQFLLAFPVACAQAGASGPAADPSFEIRQDLLVPWERAWKGLSASSYAALWTEDGVSSALSGSSELRREFDGVRESDWEARKADRRGRKRIKKDAARYLKRFEKVEHATSRREIVADVFEMVDAQHRVEPLPLEVVPDLGGNVLEVDLEKSHPRPFRKSFLGRLQHLGVDIETDDPLTMAKLCEDTADPAPDLEDPLADVGQELLDLPAHIRFIDRVEDLVARHSARFGSWTRNIGLIRRVSPCAISSPIVHLPFFTFLLFTLHFPGPASNFLPSTSYP